MDIYKEKYEQALENIKKIKAANKDNKELVDFIEYQYPELKESEDERMRNFISHELVCLRATDEQGSDRYKELTEAIAWLEKQGEKPNPYSGISFEYNGHTWGMCARDNGVEILIDGEIRAFISLEKSFIHPQPTLTSKSALEASKEEKINNQNCAKPADKVEPKFKAGDFIADGRRVLLVLANKEERNLGETYSTYCEGLALDVYGEVLVDIKNFSSYRFATDIERANFVHDLKVGTKINYKTTEWSEEEWQIIKDSACFILSCVNTVDTKEEEERLEKLADKLQNLRPQPKQKWSEEDEKILEIVTSVLQVNFEPEERFSGYEEYMNVDLINWLKSLKQRNNNE